jgi:urease accessory protein
MIVDQTIGIITDDRFHGLRVDYADVEWYNAHKKIGRLVSREGTELGLRLTDQAARRGLMDGDVLLAGTDALIAINIVPCRCIAVKTNDRAALIKLCYAVGNRHAPFFCEGDTFLLPYDEPMFNMIEKLGLRPEQISAKLLDAHRVLCEHAHEHVHTRLE